MTNAPAGWYDDGSGRQRWWDGTIWTDQYLPLAGPDAADQLQLETKEVRLTLPSKHDDRELEKLLKAGWTVQSKRKRGHLEWAPGQTDLVLTRPKVGKSKR